MQLPAPLDSDWSHWLTGEWIGMGEGTIGQGEHLVKFEPCLNQQFLLYKYVCRITSMSDDHIRYMKNSLHLNDSEIRQIHNNRFEELGIETRLAENNQILVHLFDSWRSILEGTGTWDGHREIIHFNGEKISGKRIIERIRDNKMLITREWNRPDGHIMTDNSELKRVGST